MIRYPKEKDGEYLVYYQGKLAGAVCDNCLFWKPSKTVWRLMPEADRAYLYEGFKTQIVVVVDVDNMELMAEALNAMYMELPEGKNRS